MFYYETVQKAIEFIEVNLKEDISIYDIALQVNFSVPHIYRVFKAVTGETIKTYILKRKLYFAANDLKTCKKNISEIAYEYGFESHDVFTRAFIRIYNMSPSKYRSEGTEIAFNKLIINKNLYEIERNDNMKYTVINKDKFVVIGIECQAKQWDTDGSIGRLWSKFLDNVDCIKMSIIPNVMYGICEHESCNIENQTFTYMCGLEVEETCEIPKGMVKRVIQKQKFIQAEIPEIIKTPDAYTKTSDYIKENGYIIDDFDEIEVYEEIFVDPDNHSFKLLMPIK